MRKLIVPILLLLTLFACKKEKKGSLSGLWSGYFIGNTTSGNLPLQMFFKADGTMRLYEGPDTLHAIIKAEGTYKVTGRIINCSYTYIEPDGSTFYSSSIVNPEFTFQQGTWGGYYVNDGGRFYLEKK